MQIVGLTGKKFSGKGTLAREIQKRHDGVLVYRFADPIRKMLGAMGIPSKFMEDSDLKETPIPGLDGHSFRTLAQTLGTEWGREIVCDGLWVRLMAMQLDDDRPQIAVIEDVRFPNEVEMIHGYGGKVIEVVRSGPMLGDGHSSENQALHADHVVGNDASVDDLYDEFKRLDLLIKKDD